MLASRHTRRSPLLHFDGKTNRPLRYSSNQKSPFEDEQDGNAILEPVIFEDGFLRVPATNPVLQEFLSLHPGNGRLFEEVDLEKDAQSDVEIINLEVDAMVAARDLDLSTMEKVARISLGRNAESMTSAELKRDIMIFAKTNPKGFLETINDPILELQDKVAKMFDQKLLSLRNKNRDVYFNLEGNKKKMLTVPYGEDSQSAVISYLITEEGEEVLKILGNKLK
jgi:hypothetical protein